MIRLKSFFVYSPGGENEGGNVSSDKENPKKEKELPAAEEGNEKKSFTEKIHDALQEWSNYDQQEQEFDDTRP